MIAMVFLSPPKRVLWRALPSLLLLASSLSGAALSNEVIVSMEFKHGHIMAPATVNGSNRVWLMLDTGFSIPTIDPRLADLLELRPLGKTTIAGIAGEERADVFEGPTFDFGGATYTPRRLAVLPSERSRRPRRMEGSLGQDSSGAS